MIRLLWFVVSAAAAVVLAGPAYHALSPILSALAGAPLSPDPVVGLAGLVAAGAVILTLAGFAVVAGIEGLMVALASRRVTRLAEDAGPEAPMTAARFREAFASAPFLEDIAERAAIHLIPVHRAATGLRTQGETSYDAVQATFPADRYFGPRQLVDGRLMLWLYRPLAAALWAVGVIAAALVFAHAATASPTWPALVAAAAWAFALPAAAGMVLHLVVRMIRGWRHQQAERFCATLDASLGYRSASHQLHGLMTATQDQTQTIGTAIAGLGVAFEQATTSDARARASSIDSASTALGTRIKADLEAALKEPLAHLTQASIQLSEDQSAQVQQLLRTTLKTFVGEVQGLVGQQIRDVHAVLKESTDIAQKLERSLTDSARTLTKFSKTQTAEMSEALERYRAALTSFEDKSRRDFGADFKVILEKLDHSATVFRDASAGAETLNRTLEPLLANIAAMQKALLEAIETRNLTASQTAAPVAAIDTAALDRLKSLTPPAHPLTPPRAELTEDFNKLRSLVGGTGLPEL